MRKLTLAAAAVAALATAAPAVADDTPKPDAAAKSAAKLCKEQRTTLGATAFAELYGANKNKKNALGKCVSKLAQEQPAEQEETAEATTEAAETCVAERESVGAEAFADKYGTNKNKRNAFGKCVSKLAKAKQQAS
jgi:hypothetical protein